MFGRCINNKVSHILSFDLFMTKSLCMRLVNFNNYKKLLWMLGGLFLALNSLTYKANAQISPRTITRATFRPQICEGMKTFAVQTSPSNRLVVMQNQKNNMFSVVNCSSKESVEFVCQTLYLGTTQNYCNLEAKNRFKRLKAAGLIRATRNTYSITNVGKNLISAIPKINGLRLNLRDVFSRKSIKSCHDLTTLQRVLNGETWQNAVANLTPEHSALLFASEIGMTLPVVGAVASNIAAVMNPIRKNAALLRNSIMNIRNKYPRDFKEAILTASMPSGSGSGFTAARNPNSKGNICEAMSVVSNPTNPNRNTNRERSRPSFFQRIFGTQGTQ